MIPKVIHYCWLSDDPHPAKIARCIASWNKHLPNYEIRLWDFKRFPRGKSRWVDEAFDYGKYAFAADYIRAYALYHEGGIYLDSDVEVLKSFDDFLELPYFFGRESDSGAVEAAVMGSEKGNPIFKELLDYYDTHSFISPDGTPDMLPLPSRMNNILNRRAEVVTIDSIEKFSAAPERISIFTSDYFSPIHLVNMRMERTPRTVTIHHFAGSWSSPWLKMKKTLQKLLGPTITSAIQSVKHTFNK